MIIYYYEIHCILITRGHKMHHTWSLKTALRYYVIGCTLNQHFYNILLLTFGCVWNKEITDASEFN